MFTSGSVDLELCDGAGLRHPHAKLYPTTKKSLLHSLSLAAMKLYRGNLQQFLHDSVSGSIDSGPLKCWRSCGGNVGARKPWLSLPIVLILTPEPSYTSITTSSDRDSWSYPSELTVNLPRSCEPFRYELASITARSEQNLHVVFNVDSTVCQACGGPHNSMQGHQLIEIVNSMSKAQKIVTVYYRLLGGLREQERFYLSASLHVQKTDRVLSSNRYSLINGKDELIYEKTNFYPEEDAWTEYTSVPPVYIEYFQSVWYGPSG